MQPRRSWERLIETLSRFGAATEVEPRRIEVRRTADGSRRRIQVVITPEQWNDLIDTPWGNIDDALAYVREAVTDLEGHHRFLVYTTYALEASGTPQIPADPAELEIQEHPRQHPDANSHWFALDKNGNEIDWTP